MIVFLGSPLIDMTVRVDSSILKKYNLEPNNACIMNQTNEMVFADIKTLDPKLEVGGSVTNTARVFNKLSQQSSDKSLECLYLGSIGCDEYGKFIKEQLKSENLGFKFAEIVDKPTGKVVVLLTEESRSLVTDLGASKFLSISDLEPSTWDSIIQSEFLYVSAFFISVSFSVITKIFEYFNKAKKRICMNLGAPFLCQKYNSQMNYMFANSHVVFGNEADLSHTELQNSSAYADIGATLLYRIKVCHIQAPDDVFIRLSMKFGPARFIEVCHIAQEYRSFARIHRIEQHDLKQTLIDTNRLFNGDRRSRTLIVTNGHKNVTVAVGQEIQEFEVPTVEKVADTNGAGDAFVGGFLASYVCGKDISECVKLGIKLAGISIQSFGFDLAHRDANLLI